MKNVKRWLVFLFGTVLIFSGLPSVWAQDSYPSSFFKESEGLLEAYKMASKRTEPAPKIVGGPRALKAAETVLFSNDIERGNPVVRVMPAYYTWPGEEASIWGAVVQDNDIGDFTGAAYSWDFGDGSVPETGTVTDPNFILVKHTYITAGTKTATLTVDTTGTEKPAATLSKSVKINVQVDNLETRRLKALEDGLRYLYTEARTNGQIGDSNENPGETGLNVLAFEEQGHYAFNDPDDDIYASVVRRGLDFIVNNAKKFVFAEQYETQHPGEPDTNGNGFGIYLSEGQHCKYATGINMLTIIASRTPSEVVESGAAEGMTYKELLQDIIDYFAFTQSDTTSTKRGGWQYNVEHSGNSDNSCAQWPVLGFLAAEQEWGCYVPQWVKDENLKWLVYSQNDNGGFGYDSPTNWVNIGKTGAGLCQMAWQDMKADDEMVTKTLDYLNEYWSSRVTRDGHFNSNFYALYAVTKGCRLMRYDNGDQVNTIGDHNWWNEYVDFLVNDETFGQDYTGKWSNAYWNWHGEETLSTSLSILVLSPGVFELPPVAAITGPDGAQPEVNVSFSGAGSFHQDPQKSIVEWLWDFEKSDGIDWNRPNAVGQNVVKVGGWSIEAASDTFYVTLRVKDNSSPSMYDTEEHMIIITGEINHPPIAVAGGPYTGQPGVPIQLDGTGSYDPDPGDSIVSYEWDLDGDGEYDDSTDPQPTITWNDVKEGLVGLRVYDQDGLSSSDEAPVYVEIWTSERDIEISDDGLQISNPFPSAGETITLNVSGMYVANDGKTLDEFAIRFYNGNPDSSFILIADRTVENTNPGDTFGVSVSWTVPADRKSTVWVKLDSDEQVNEYDETNNTDSAYIGKGGEVTVQLYFDPDPARIIGAGGIPTIVSLSVRNVSDLFGANIDLSFDLEKVNVVSMEPGDFFSTDLDNPSDFSTFDNDEGTIEISLTRLGGSGINGGGSIADIKFVGVAGDPTSDLTFESYTLRDSKNHDIPVDSVDDGAFEGISSLLGDFDNNMTVDFVDYTQLIVYWNAGNVNGDIVGPLGAVDAGSPPWSKEGYPSAPDGEIDFEDQMVFALMYNWYQSVVADKKAKPAVAARIVPSPFITGLNWDKEDHIVGDKFIVSLNPGHINNFLGAEIILRYDSDIIRVNNVFAGSAYNIESFKFPVLYTSLQGNLTASTVVLGNLKSGITLPGENLFEIEFEVISEGVFRINLLDLDMRNFRNIPIPVTTENQSIAGKIGTSLEVAPLAFGLSQNFPNPFNMSTTITYTLDKPGKVDIRIYNSIGQEVMTLVDDTFQAGHHSAVWDGRNNEDHEVTSGVYIVRLRQGNRTESKQILLIK